MDPDTALVLGIFLAAFALPSIVSAFADRRTPRTSAIMVLIAGSFIIYALQSRPGGYGWSDIPEAFVRVIARLL